MASYKPKKAKIIGMPKGKVTAKIKPIKVKTHKMKP